MIIRKINHIKASCNLASKRVLFNGGSSAAAIRAGIVTEYLINSGSTHGYAAQQGYLAGLRDDKQAKRLSND